MRTWPLVLLVACNNDTSFVESATCDGVQQPGEATVDAGFDRDGDGYFDANNPDCADAYPAESLDCDDADEAVNPGETEVACDGVDQDCDETTEDGDAAACADFSGNWQLSQAVQYQCANSILGYLVNIDFQTVAINDAIPFTITSIGTGSQPGTTTGTRDDLGAFSANRVISGACTETYTFSGTFDDADHFSGAFTTSFSGTGCSDCTVRNFPLAGTRQ